MLLDVVLCFDFFGDLRDEHFEILRQLDAVLEFFVFENGWTGGDDFEIFQDFP